MYDMSDQFGITNKHQYAIHTHMSTNASDAKTYFSDDSSQNCIEIFLINSKEEKNEDDFWQEPENIS